MRFRKYSQFVAESEAMKGGLADGKTVADIAKKHDVDASHIEKQLAMGSKVELEHTDSEKAAREVAMDHLWEDPSYYTKLKKVEDDPEEE